MRYLFGAAIFATFATCAYLNEGPRWMAVVLVLLGIGIGVFAAAGRPTGDTA